jgi:hypothetical protein
MLNERFSRWPIYFIEKAPNSTMFGANSDDDRLNSKDRKHKLPHALPIHAD